MPNYSLCGIDCNACKHKEKDGCKGCQTNEGKIFWGECDLYSCCASKKLEHCGHCSDFACSMLQEWTAVENDDRIDNLRSLIQ